MVDVMARLDSVGQLMDAFRAVEPRSDAARKLDLLLDLEHVDSPRVLSFLLRVLKDSGEPERVRIDVLSRLRDAPLPALEHRRVGRAIGRLMLVESSHLELRNQSALVLGKFVDVPGVVDALGALLTDTAAPAELRYNAFTSVYLRGPSADSVELLSRLSSDETLGPCAQTLLRSWDAMLPPACRGFPSLQSDTEGGRG
jgi:hypothetical protein